jgi:hypothetical protein
MIIDYQEVYIRLHFKINGASEKKQQAITKKIEKLGEWINVALNG